MSDTFTAVIRALNDFLYPEPDFEGMPIEHIDAELKRSGIDPMPLARKLQLAVAKQVSSVKLSKARELRERLLRFLDSAADAQTLRQVRDVIEKTREELLGDIQARLADPALGISAAYFRKLEQVSKADLETFLADITALERITHCTDAENRA